MGIRQAAVAQAQAQQQTNISSTESLELVRCLLRVSIFHVSYLRGLFPEKSFKGVDMKNLDDMHIKMLLPACDESRRLVDWVEGGVYDAIKRGYLKNLFFGISHDPDGTQLLEEYIFTFKYGDGKVSMDINAVAVEGDEGGSKKRGKKGDFKQEAAKADLNTVRYQVCRLIRMLVQVCHTLDKVPAERYLFMKLTYQDHTPEEYEPPYFVPVDESGIGHFKRSPFSMAVGRVATDHHSVSLKVKSTLDSCEDDIVEEDAADELAGGANRGNRPNDRITAQAQPSAGSVGSGDDVGATTATGAAVAVDAMEEGDDEELRGVEPTAAPRATPSAITSQTQPPDASEGGGGDGPCSTRHALREQSKKREQPTATGGASNAMDLDLAAAITSTPGADKATPVVTTAEALPAPQADGDREEDVTEAPEAEDYVAVREFLRGRTQVTLRQLGKEFGTLSQGALDGYVGRLTEQGLLTAIPGARKTFRVHAQPPPSSQAAGVHSAPPAEAVNNNNNTSNGKSKKRNGGNGHTNADEQVAAAARAAADKGDLHEQEEEAQAEEENAAAMLTERLDGLSMGPEAAAMRSRGGRLESVHGGDELTGSADVGGAAGGAVGTKRAAADPTEAAEEPNVYIVDSQMSGPERRRGARARKASYVADPIQQGASKKARTAAGAAAVAPSEKAPVAADKTTSAIVPPDAGAAAHTGGAAAVKGSAPTPRGKRGSSRLATLKR